MVSCGSDRFFTLRPAFTLTVRLQSLLHLTLRECGLLLVALPVVTAVRLALWLLPSRAILRIISRLRSSPRMIADKQSTLASSIPWAVEAVSRGIPRATCLTQAVAAKVMLGWFGEDAQLCLGVAHTSDGALRAHAWLERNGRPVLGGFGIKSMVRLPDLPDPPPLPASFIR